MGEPVLEAFYLIAPRLSFKDGKIASREAEVAYCYPPDTRHRFVDIPFFCFPDLEQIKLESMALSRQEHFSFTLTDDQGTRFYGVCMRYLDQGHGMRFDVGLRPRICLCIITRHNQPSLFRLMLLLLHSLLLYHSNDLAALEPLLQNICAQAFPRLGGLLRLDAGIERPIQISVPLHAKHSEVMSLPLLQRLGSVGLLTLMSVCLTERRIIFTADDMTTLSSAVHACVSLLYPFEWHHIYIPVLPAKLLGYVSAPMPFIIGVKRYMMQQVLAQPTSDIVIVDVDKGEITTTGDTALTTFLGRSGTMLRQATEGFERVKHRALKILHTFQQSDADDQQLAHNSTRDAVACVLTELKAINLKHTQIKWPGKSLVTGKQGDEWQTAAEQRLRETLLLFFLYHFHDVDRVVRRAGTSSTQRSQLDSFRAAFVNSRRAAGDGPAVLSFLQEFVHSQMFEQFCGNTAEPQNASGSEDAELADTFTLCRKKLRSTQLAPTIPNIQKVIRSVLHDENATGEAASRSAHGSTYYDKMALALTSNSDAQFDTQRAAEQVIARAFNSEHFTKIMRTLRYRLQDCKGGNWRHGNKALALLAVLLVSGPEYVLSETLQFFHQIRALKAYRSAIPASYVRMIRNRATRCVQLVLDHRVLLLQRRWALSRQQGFVVSRNVQISKVALAPGGAIPRLGALHEQLRPASMPVAVTSRLYDDSQQTPLMSVPSSESDDSMVYLQNPLAATEDDPFVRVSAIELLLGGIDGDDAEDNRQRPHESAAQSRIQDSNLLELDEFLQRSPTPYARSSLRSEALFPPSEPTTPSSSHAAGGRGMSEWRSSFEDSYKSRSGSIADSLHSTAEPDDDILEMLSSTNSNRQQHARSVSEQELLRPPTPDAFDQFALNSAPRPETNPFAMTAFANDPFGNDPFAKPATSSSSSKKSSIDLLSADSFDSTPLQPAHRPKQTSASVSDLLDLMNQSHSPSVPATMDVFGSSTQPLMLTPAKATPAATAHAFMSATPPHLGQMGMMSSPFPPQQPLMPATPGMTMMQPMQSMQPTQQGFPQYSPYYSGNGQFASGSGGQMFPSGGLHSVSGLQPQHAQPAAMTPVRHRTYDPFADLGLPNSK